MSGTGSVKVPQCRLIELFYDPGCLLTMDCWVGKIDNIPTRRNRSFFRVERGSFDMDVSGFDISTVLMYM